MLKRLSAQFNKDSPNDPALLLPPPGARSPAPLSPRSSPSLASVPLPSPTSPFGSSYPFPSAPPSSGRSERGGRREEEGRKAIDRQALHKTLSSLSNLLIALDDLRETSLARAKAEKRLAKAAREVSSGFGERAGGGRCDEAYEALSAAAEMLETLQEVDEGHAKLVKKEYEGVNESVGRYFRKTSVRTEPYASPRPSTDPPARQKDEKAFDDMMASLNARVAKTTSAYQSVAHSATVGRNMHAALDNLTSQHSSYMQQLSNLSYQIQEAKRGYGEAIAERRETTVKEVARVVCRLAESVWRSDIEGVKKGGQKVGRLASASIWVQPEMGVAVAAASRDDVDEQVGSVPPQRSMSLRGPRAPSTATNDSSAASTAPSSGPRVALRQNPPSYRSDTVSQTMGDSPAASSQPVSPRTVPQNDSSALRKPIPRYGSAPAVPSAARADEFGRMPTGVTEMRGNERPQQDSFVARMSAKYSSATGTRVDPHQSPPQVRPKTLHAALTLMKRIARPPIRRTPAPTLVSPCSPSDTRRVPMHTSHRRPTPTVLFPRLHRKHLRRDHRTDTRTACSTRSLASRRALPSSSSRALPSQASRHRSARGRTKPPSSFRLVSTTRRSRPASPPRPLNLPPSSTLRPAPSLTRSNRFRKRW